MQRPLTNITSERTFHSPRRSPGFGSSRSARVQLRHRPGRPIFIWSRLCTSTIWRQSKTPSRARRGRPQQRTCKPSQPTVRICFCSTVARFQSARGRPKLGLPGLSTEADEGIEQTPMSIAEKFASMEYGPAPEDSKEAVSWLERHGYRFQHFIGGGWQAPAAGEDFDTVDPSNGEKLASVVRGCGGGVEGGVEA